MSVDPDTLADRIYQAALFPEDWPGVLHDLACLVDAAGTTLLTRRADAWIGWRFSPAMAVHGEAYLTSGVAAQSQTTPRLLKVNRAGFVPEHEFWGEEEFLNDPMMVHWGSPSGLHRAAATAIALPGGDAAVVHIQRYAGRPRFEPEAIASLDAMRPHLSRAAMLAARWRLERLRAATTALERLGIPAAVLDESGRVLLANAGIEAMDSHVVWRARERLTLHDRQAAELLRAYQERVFRTEKAGGCSIPAKGRDEAPPAIVHAVPISGPGQDLFGGGLVLLVINPLDGAGAPDPSVIQGLFDLSAAEARVAVGLLDGASIADMSQAHGVSLETIRTQLKAVFAKSGVGRQAEFVAKFRQALSPGS